MSPRTSKSRSAKYPNLYRMPNQPNWVYRKYSSEKRENFYCSTGIPAEDRLAAQAYKIGVDRFGVWLGAFSPTDASSTVRDLAAILIAQKEEGSAADRTRSIAMNQIQNHILPLCGHMKPASLTGEWWGNFQRQVRRRPIVKKMPDGSTKTSPPLTRLFNTRKILRELLGIAKGRGLVESIPEFPLSDPEPPPPVYIPKAHVLRIIRFAGRISSYELSGTTVPDGRYRVVRLKLLVYVMWKMGGRPDEVLQYRWDMIRWEDGEYGSIEIPSEITKTRRPRTIPLNSGVSRVLKFLRARTASEWVFPSAHVPGQRWKWYAKSWSTVTQRIGFDYEVYNLRDTWITDRLVAGKSDTFVAKYCDTSPAMIQKRYAVAVQSAMQGVAE